MINGKRSCSSPDSYDGLDTLNIEDAETSAKRKLLHATQKPRIRSQPYAESAAMCGSAELKCADMGGSGDQSNECPDTLTKGKYWTMAVRRRTAGSGTSGKGYCRSFTEDWDIYGGTYSVDNFAGTGYTSIQKSKIFHPDKSTNSVVGISFKRLLCDRSLAEPVCEVFKIGYCLQNDAFRAIFEESCPSTTECKSNDVDSTQLKAAGSHIALHHASIFISNSTGTFVDPAYACDGTNPDLHEFELLAF
jgi:hypothetical protein